MIGSNGALFSLCKNQSEVPRGYAPPAFGSVSVETIQETSEIFVLADVEGGISQFISNGWTVTINGAGLYLPVLIRYIRKSVTDFTGVP